MVLTKKVLLTWSGHCGLGQGMKGGRGAGLPLGEKMGGGEPHRGTPPGIPYLSRTLQQSNIPISVSHWRGNIMGKSLLQRRLGVNGWFCYFSSKLIYFYNQTFFAFFFCMLLFYIIVKMKVRKDFATTISNHSSTVPTYITFDRPFLLNNELFTFIYELFNLTKIPVP